MAGPATQPDFEQFLKVLRREGKPSHLPLYEHIASGGFVDRATGKPFTQMSWDDPEMWQTYVDFWIDLGFDCVPMEIGLNLPMPSSHHEPGTGSIASEERVCIRTMEDFEKYPWPDESNPFAVKHFETVAGMLPEGAKIVGGVCGGPYESASAMLGVMGLSMLLFDNPELVDAVFEKLGQLYVAANNLIAGFDAIGALRQGDDLGFKTSTFLSPEDLRRLIFPIYKRMVAVAHEHGKPFILHSCGNLATVYDDLIDDVKIDAKHSFEEAIMPVQDFKAVYGKRVTPLGGLDVDMICRASEADLRAYTRKKVEACFADGYYALGTGNSLTDYMPVENYKIMVDEGRKVAAEMGF